jgi:hypothetical protein
MVQLLAFSIQLTSRKGEKIISKVPMAGFDAAQIMLLADSLSLMVEPLPLAYL